MEFGRQREPRSTCFRCEEPLHGDGPLCPCGAPTGHMSFRERNEYEVERWRRVRQEASA